MSFMLVSRISNRYSITNSVRLNGTSDYLSRTPGAAATSRRTWSFSAWVKKCGAATYQYVLSANRGGQTDSIAITSGDTIRFFLADGADADVVSTAVLRDCSGWYHLCVTVDTTQVTASDRVKIYLNGTQLTSFGTANYPAQNYDTYIGHTVSHSIGRYANGGSATLHAYGSDLCLIDGQALTPSSFGKTDANGVWVPIRYTGTYGTNGCKLEFLNSAALGTDTSGNGNNWTVNGFAASDQMVDTPTNNYATLNPLDWNAGTATVANGNLKFTGSSGDNLYKSTIALNSGKWYFRAKFDSIANSAAVVGLHNNTSPFFVLSYLGRNDSNGWGFKDNGYYNGANVVSWSFADFVTNDYIDVAFDIDAGKIWIGKNGTWQASGNPDAGTNAYFTNLTGALPIHVCVSAYLDTLTMDFQTAAPANATNFKNICTANLPAVGIKKPSDHFNIVLDAGANIKTSSEALYTYFLEWIKDRVNSNDHQLIDTVRGTSAVLHSNDANNETTYSAPSGTSVGWVWNAASTSASNTTGSITSTVSVNTTAGFSVLTYTGTGVNATLGHGLGAAPKLVIVKRRTGGGTEDWVVWHTNLTSADYYLLLNGSAAQASSTAMWNSTAPSSTVISVGTNSRTNGNTLTYVAYCFAEIPGYSKFGTYSAVQNVFVHCGFRPRYILVKSSSSVSSWNIIDTSINPYNPALSRVYAGSATIAADYGNGFDILSNGFVVRETTGGDANTGTMIYAAFAEHPFGGSNVVPSPAR